MSNVGVHDFTIPHEHVQPTRDMITIRLPLPPKMIGSLQVPETFRDMAKHNVMAGRVVAMGPVAFAYKDGNGGLAKQDVKLGDWVTFRPYAGTQVMGGKVVGAGGSWRYISSFQDVIGIIPADRMPDPATLIWNDEEGEPKADTMPSGTQTVSFGGEPRERVKASDLTPLKARECTAGPCTRRDCASADQCLGGDYDKIAAGATTQEGGR